MIIEDRIRQIILDSGFDCVGFTDAQIPATYPFYEDWLERNQHGTLQWLSREDRKARRRDLSLLLPNIQSVIVVGISYGELDLKTNPKASEVSISAYACRPDYHEMIDQKLKKIIASLTETWAGQHRFSVDYGAVLERDLAVRAGFGFFGKSTMLIHQQMGTSFFIGEILTTLKLEPSVPNVYSACGSCQLCQKACPTQALGLYEVNTARCISYLTIENKGEIPLEMRPMLGNRIFGCDTCQAVCPHNLRRSSEFSPQIGEKLRDFWEVKVTDETHYQQLRHLPLSDLLQMSEVTFLERFKQTPIIRATYAGLMRNVAVAAGNSQDRSLIRLLEAQLGKISPMVDEHLRWAMEVLDKN